MFRRYFLPVLAGIAFIISTNVIASAQVGQLRGHVVLTQADGTKVPAAEAVIDVFRTDVSGKYNTKTNKKGEFIFAGLPYAGDYIIAASLPAAQPNWLGRVKAGRDLDYEIVLTPGDGKRLTLDEINAAKKGAGDSGRRGNSEPDTSQLSAEDKAKAAELAKQAAEIAARNEKAMKSNEIVARTFQAGNDAINAKNYDEAIKQYEEGLAADPEQPALLVNEGRAYTARGVSRYNAAVTSTDEAAKGTGIESAKSDFKAAAAATTKAVMMIKAQPVPTDPAELGRYNNNKLAAYTVNAEAHRLFVSKADPSQADAGLAAFKDYIAVETDPAKKAKAQLDAAQLLLDAGAVDKAFAEFQTIVTAEPDNPDANLGAGLSLFASGDKAKYQDAANFLQHYVDVAPETHKFKADAKAILAELKNTEKVVPEKTAPPRRRRP
jgi:tetratricopeptide (TPR) repeat protein